MTNYVDMTYDEQRAFLGLPDVSDYLMREQLKRDWAKIQRAGRLIGDALKLFRPTLVVDVQDDYGLTRGGRP